MCVFVCHYLLAYEQNIALYRNVIHYSYIWNVFWLKGNTQILYYATCIPLLLCLSDISNVKSIYNMSISGIHYNKKIFCYTISSKKI